MDEDVRAFGTELGRRAVARDWPAVHAMLAISFAGGKLRDIPAEVTDDNVRYWMKLRVQCSDEQMDELGFDCFCEVWMAGVETAEGLRVGYWSQGAY